MRCTPLGYECRELGARRKRKLFCFHGFSLKPGSGIGAEDATFNRHPEDMAKDGGGVVVSGSTRGPGMACRPTSAIGRGDTANFNFVQSGPDFLHRSQDDFPVKARPCFEADVFVDALHVERRRLAEGHLGAGGINLLALAFAMLFLNGGEAGFGDGKMCWLKRLPNFLAVQKKAGIVAARFVADEILKSRFSPSLYESFSSWKMTVKAQPKKPVFRRFYP